MAIESLNNKRGYSELNLAYPTRRFKCGMSKQTLHAGCQQRPDSTQNTHRVC